MKENIAKRLVGENYDNGHPVGGQYVSTTFTLHDQFKVNDFKADSVQWKIIDNEHIRCTFLKGNELLRETEDCETWIFERKDYHWD